MGDIGQQNLINIIGQARADFTATVGTGSTDTALVLVGLDLGSANLASGYVLLGAGALGAGTGQALEVVASTPPRPSRCRRPSRRPLRSAPTCGCTRNTPSTS